LTIGEKRGKAGLEGFFISGQRKRGENRVKQDHKDWGEGNQITSLRPTVQRVVQGKRKQKTSNGSGGSETAKTVGT